MRVANQNGKWTGITGGAMEKPMGCYSARSAGIPPWREDVWVKAEQGAGLERTPEIPSC